MKKIVVLLLSVFLLLPTFHVIAEQTAEPTIEVGSVEGKAGETVEIPVRIKNNPGICNFTLDVVYDETKLQYNGATVNKNFASYITEGEYIVWWDMANSTYNGEIFTLSFTVLDTVQGGETAVSIAYDNKTGGITNWNEDFVEFNTIPGSVNVLLGEVMYGDVDNDQLINLNDLITLAQYMADWEELEINLAASDVTKNGEIDLEDVTRLARYIAGWNIKLN